jgi:cystathionine beta-lyase/cystathionine gamma-synthase
MDNTWASHVRFQPLEYGIDIVVQATTKYEGGYGDTPSGIVIAKHPQDLQIAKSVTAQSHQRLARDFITELTQQKNVSINMLTLLNG